MKRIFAICVALVLTVAVLCVPASAVNLDNKYLTCHFWYQDTATWTWLQATPGDVMVNLGETYELKWTDFSNVSTLATTANIQFGVQIDDGSFDTDGDTSKINVTVSDIVIKADGYDDVTVAVAGTYDYDLGPLDTSAGYSQNHCFTFNDQVTAAVTAVAGSDAASIQTYLAAVTEATMTITYNSYNGETAEGAAPAEAEAEEAPAEAEAEAPAEAEEAPAEAPAEAETTEAPTETAKAPSTGIALAVVPAVMALAAAAVSKKH